MNAASRPLLYVWSSKADDSWEVGHGDQVMATIINEPLGVDATEFPRWCPKVIVVHLPLITMKRVENIYIICQHLIN